MLFAQVVENRRELRMAAAHVREQLAVPVVVVVPHPAAEHQAVDAQLRAQPRPRAAVKGDYAARTGPRTVVGFRMGGDR